MKIEFETPVYCSDKAFLSITFDGSSAESVGKRWNDLKQAGAPMQRLVHALRHSGGIILNAAAAPGHKVRRDGGIENQMPKICASLHRPTCFKLSAYEIPHIQFTHRF